MTQGRYDPDRRFQPSIDTELDYTSENLEEIMGLLAIKAERSGDAVAR